MINGHKTSTDKPEKENMIKLHESELNTITKTTFVVGMICGHIVTMLLMILSDVIKYIFG